MKEQKNFVKNNYIKKLFIKICRFLGYEIIDQSNFYIPTQDKSINENLSIQGKKSITLPLGEIKITRKIKSLTVILRSCTKVNMLTQSKKRLFDQDKSEYTFRSLNSIITSLKLSSNNFPKINFDIIVVDHGSKENDLNQMKKQLKNSNLKNSIVSLNVNDFSADVKKLNAKNTLVTENQISNMCNIYKSFLLAKNQCEDLIYFAEDDYLHEKISISEMIYSYERLSSQLNRELVLCPADYPYLYTKLNSTNIFMGTNRHWRQVDETLCTFLTSKLLLERNWNEFISMCKFEHYPFEQPLHNIYKSECCLSPIPSLAIHLTNVNSIFGLSPNVDWTRLWNENKDY